MKIEFSPPQPDEMNLVFDSWANSFKKSPWAGCVPNHLWDTVSRATATELISRSVVVCAVARLEDGGRRVMGYAVAEPGVLHWLYVKRDYRKMGVGAGLRDRILAGFPDVTSWRYSHRTPASAKFLGSRFTWDAVTARVKK